jgi:hypothetical protein
MQEKSSIRAPSSIVRFLVSRSPAFLNSFPWETIPKNVGSLERIFARRGSRYLQQNHARSLR